MADWEERFDGYVERLGDVLGHADRRAPLRAYATGLLLPGERKSVEPMAARVDPARVGAAHQSLHHFVAKAAWDDAALLEAVRDHVLPAMLERGPIRAWIVDDTGLPKRGRLSVGVARQYCGQLGKRENCQVAVTLSVVTDAGYGNATDFRDGVTGLGLSYVAGIQGTTTLWPPGTGPLPAGPWSGKGRPPKRLRRDAAHQPLAAEAAAAGLPAAAWRTVTWREGTAGPLASRFAAVRVRPAHDDFRRSEPRAEEWLLAEWPEGEGEPTKYWLSTLPETAPLEELVATAKLRWRVERDFEELKQELGLGHFEGRSWRGFHHHASLCIAAYGFLVAERWRFRPPGRRPRPRAPERPADYRPRNPPRAPRAAQPGLDRHPAPAPGGGADAPPAALPLLPAGLRAAACVQQFMTR